MAEEQRALATAVAPRLPYPADAQGFGYGPDTWRVLTEAIFPGARSAHSVILALAYCKARNLDPLKRPVHIVPVWDSKRGCEVETIWPGIGELRTTAARTGAYAGKDKTLFGPTTTETFKDDKGETTVAYPEWAQVTVYRIVKDVRCAFEGPKVFWKETYATRSGKSSVPNAMWADRPSGQLEKCGEAASLRAAFPEEIGNDYAAEEMEGRKFESLGKTPEGHELSRPRRKSEAPGAAQVTPAQEVKAMPIEEPVVMVDRSNMNKVMIEDSAEKKGGGKTFYAIKAQPSSGPMIEVTTFNPEHHKMALGLKGNLALIETSVNGKYTNLVRIEPYVADAPVEAQDGPGANG